MPDIVIPPITFRLSDALVERLRGDPAATARYVEAEVRGVAYDIKQLVAAEVRTILEP